MDTSSSAAAAATAAAAGDGFDSGCGDDCE